MKWHITNKLFQCLFHFEIFVVNVIRLLKKSKYMNEWKTQQFKINWYLFLSCFKKYFPKM